MSASVKLSYYRKMLHIQRIPGVFKTRPYNLAEHSYYVAILFSRFSKLENIGYSASQLELVMDHDVLETISVDLPYHVKNLNHITKDAWRAIENEVIKAKPAFREVSDDALEIGLSKEQFKLFKACDLLELWIFCKEEQLLGNRSEEIQKVITTCEGLLQERLRFESIIKYMEEWNE